ncbi:MAG: protein kinase [Planctomycetaceae bacterium]|nr:protein kinase [Planctomycetaceae bacterium]
MNDPNDGGLDDLVAACLGELEESGLDALEAFCRRHPTRADELRRRIEVLLDSGLLATPESAPPLPERLGPYRVVGRLGGGGMGIVFLGEQEGLDREVAIKAMRPELAPFGDARERFRREVSSLAKLSHPGLVPVFGCGEHEGLPWFAMERIRGANLAEVLHVLRRAEPSSLTGADLAFGLERASGETPIAAELFTLTWPRACLTIARDLAQALEHAHRRGVLHRDVKPSNVLLGLDGRARLFDFGLSRIELADELTRTGALVGSPPYMAPEQVRSGKADARTDVYGLGALLYELLALVPPFGERDPVLLREAIARGLPSSALERAHGLTRDGRAVLRCALEVDAGRRYASAQAFADDLDALLEGRAVVARPAGAALRAVRFAKRRPVLSTVLAFAGLFAVVAPIALFAHGERLSRELDATAAERDRALVAFEYAEDAVYDLLTRFGSESLRDIPGTEQLRLEVLERAEQLYASLTDAFPDVDRLIPGAGLVKREHALALDSVGRREEAKALRETVVERIQEYAERSPQTPGLWLEVADTLLDEVEALQRFGDADGALVGLDRVDECLQRVLSHDDLGADVEGTGLRLAIHALHARAFLTWRDGRPEEALKLLARKLERLDELEALGVVLPLERGESFNMRARILFRLDRHDESRVASEAARATVLAALETDDDTKLSELLGEFRYEEALRCRNRGEWEEAVRFADLAAEALEPVVARHPQRVEARELIANAAIQAGIAFQELRDPEGALVRMRKAARYRDEVVALRPDDLERAGDRAIVHLDLATTLINTFRREEAIASARVAREGLARLAETGDEEARLFGVFAELTLAQARLEIEPLDVEFLRERIETGSGGDPVTLAIFACVLADASALEKNPDRAEELAAAAVATLDEAIDSGYDNVYSVDHSHEYDPLRDREDFRAVRARL